MSKFQDRIVKAALRDVGVSPEKRAKRKAQSAIVVDALLNVGLESISRIDDMEHAALKRYLSDGIGRSKNDADYKAIEERFKNIRNSRHRLWGNPEEK